MKIEGINKITVSPEEVRKIRILCMEVLDNEESSREALDLAQELISATEGLL